MPNLDSTKQEWYEHIDNTFPSNARLTVNIFRSFFKALVSLVYDWGTGGGSNATTAKYVEVEGDIATTLGANVQLALEKLNVNGDKLQNMFFHINLTDGTFELRDSTDTLITSIPLEELRDASMVIDWGDVQNRPDIITEIGTDANGIVFGYRDIDNNLVPIVTLTKEHIDGLFTTDYKQLYLDAVI